MLSVNQKQLKACRSEQSASCLAAAQRRDLSFPQMTRFAPFDSLVLSSLLSPQGGFIPSHKVIP